MLLLQLIACLSVLVSAQAKPDSGCPKLEKSAPPISKPKNCPDPKTVAPVNGTLRDNECLVGGIMGVCIFFDSYSRKSRDTDVLLQGDFFNACYAPNVVGAIGSILTGGKDGGGVSKAKQDWSGGSGPFNAKYFTDTSLPLHTIYGPKVVIPGKKLPLVVWVRSHQL